MKIWGALHYLWRAVDQDGDAIDILVQNLFRQGRHLLSAGHYRLHRDRSFNEWSAVTES